MENTNFDNSSKIEIELSEEMISLMEEIDKTENKFNEEKASKLIDSCKDVVIASILGPFGLTKLMQVDTDGGSVTTLHNAKKEVYANDKDKKRYERDYNAKKYRDDNQKYEAKKEELKNQFENNELKDIYTGKDLKDKIFQVDKNGNARQRVEYDTEHIVAAKEIHDNSKAKLYLTEEEATNIANDDSNLGAINYSINSSKRQKELEEWLELPSTNDSSLTNAEYYKINKKEALKKNSQARKKLESKLQKAELKYYAVNIGLTGLKQGAKLGLREVLGLLLKEFVEGVFTEIKTIKAKKENNKKNLIDQFKESVSNIVTKLRSKWKDFLSVFKDGFISGFFSNLITVVVNMFITTVKRIVKIIREGILSLFKAIKLIVNPPKEMSSGDVFFEATKIIGAAITTIIGLLMEEAVEDFIKSIPFLTPFASFIAPVITATITGIATVFVVYAIDSLKQRIQFTHNKLINVNQHVLLTKYKSLQTMILLEKSYMFSSQITNYIYNESIAFENSQNEHIREIGTKKQNFNELLAKFNNITKK